MIVRNILLLAMTIVTLVIWLSECDYIGIVMCDLKEKM